MRNIWVYIVGGILALGAGIALYNAIDASSPQVATAPAPRAANQAEAAPAAVTVPEPDARFDKVEITDTDLIVGRKEAPVTIVEYASLTCPHCARFHQNVLPTIKKDYIDTGKVRLVYRDFPLDRWALNASMIARCAGPERRYAFVEAFFAQQDSWTSNPNPAAGLASIARLGGLDQTTFDACLQDQKVGDAAIQERLTGSQTFDIQSTPTIIVNGDRYSGGLSVEQLRAVIEKKLK